MNNKSQILQVYLNKLRDNNINILKIPNYQRNYSWTEEHVRRLIKDIYNNQENIDYFLGTIIILNDANSYLVIDGQQRLSTILLIMKILETKFNKNYKLADFSFKSHNHQDLDYLEKLLKSPNLNSISNQKQEYYKNIKNIERELDELENIEKFINNFNKTFLSVVFLQKEINQYKVFSSINSTGKPLTTLELIKSYLLSRFEEFGLENEELYLTNLIDWIPNNNISNKTIDDGIRYFIGFINNELVNKNTMDIYSGFLEIFNKSNEQEYFLQKWNEFYKFMSYYLYIHDSKFQDEFESMIIIQNSLDTYSILIIDILYSFSDFDKSTMPNAILEQINIIDHNSIDKCLLLIEYLRLNLGFVTTNEKQHTRKIPIIKKEIINKKDYPNELYNYLFNKFKLVDCFSLCEHLCKNNIYLLNEKLTLSLLLRIESFGKNLKISKNNKLSVEHILPEKHYKWENDNFENTQMIKPFLHTLCNLTILQKYDNSSLSNEIWHGENGKKSKLINKDSFVINNTLRQFDDWNIDNMQKWTELLTSKIQKIWNFNNSNNLQQINISKLVINPNNKTYDYYIEKIKDVKKTNCDLVINFENIKKALWLKLVEHKQVDKEMNINSKDFFAHSLLCILFNTDSIKKIDEFDEHKFRQFIEDKKESIQKIIDDINYW